MGKRHVWKAVLIELLMFILSGTSVSAAVVAKIGNKTYASLQTAVNIAENGQTVTLMGKVNAKKQLVIKGKKITIDFAGYSYKYTSRKKECAIQIKSKSKVTFKRVNMNSDCRAFDICKGCTGTFAGGNIKGQIYNAGKLNIVNGSFSGKGKDKNGTLPAIVNDGTMKITNGSFSGTKRMILVNKGKATILNGNFTTKKYSAIYNSPSGNIKIYDGTYSYTSSNSYDYLFLNEGTATFYGGTYKGYLENVSSGKKRMLIVSGVFRGLTGNICIRNIKGNMTIPGGAFSTMRMNTVVNNEEGNLTITGGSFVTKSNEGYFALYNLGILSVTGGNFLMNGSPQNSIGCTSTSYWSVVTGNVKGTVEEQN